MSTESNIVFNFLMYGINDILLLFSLFRYIGIRSALYVTTESTAVTIPTGLQVLMNLERFHAC